MENIESLSIHSETFRSMKNDFDSMMQVLLRKMAKKGINEGKLSLEIKIKLEDRDMPVYDGTDDVTDTVQVPTFEHKVTYSLTEKEDKKGTFDSEMRLVWDEKLGMYVMKYMNQAQRSMFDDDFEQNLHNTPFEEKKEEDDLKVYEQKTIEQKTLELPMNHSEEPIDVEAVEVSEDDGVTWYKGIADIPTEYMAMVKTLAGMFVNSAKKEFGDEYDEKFKNIESAKENYSSIKWDLLIDIHDNWAERAEDTVKFGNRTKEGRQTLFKLSVNTFLILVKMVETTAGA